jgi:hypothetical protein
MPLQGKKRPKAPRDAENCLGFQILRFWHAVCKSKAILRTLYGVILTDSPTDFLAPVMRGLEVAAITVPGLLRIVRLVMLRGPISSKQSRHAQTSQGRLVDQGRIEA